MKVAKKPEATVKDDPNPLDRVNWQRLRIAADDEAIHRDWGCALFPYIVAVELPMTNARQVTGTRP